MNSTNQKNSKGRSDTGLDNQAYRRIQAHETIQNGHHPYTLAACSIFIRCRAYRSLKQAFQVEKQSQCHQGKQQQNTDLL